MSQYFSAIIYTTILEDALDVAIVAVYVIFLPGNGKKLRNAGMSPRHHGQSCIFRVLFVTRPGWRSFC
jgi:hypothetical protein